MLNVTLESEILGAEYVQLYYASYLPTNRFYLCKCLLFYAIMDFQIMRRYSLKIRSGITQSAFADRPVAQRSTPHPP